MRILKLPYGVFKLRQDLVWSISSPIISEYSRVFKCMGSFKDSYYDHVSGLSLGNQFAELAFNWYLQ